MKNNILFIFILSALSNVLIAQDGCLIQGLHNLTNVDCEFFEHGDWVLVFEDDFEGNHLNKDVWYTCEDGWDRVHGAELQYYKDDNIFIQDGILHLEAREEPGMYEYWDFHEDGTPFLTSDFFQYTSGWIQTKKSFLYGKIEVKCRIPSGQGLWPAFWLFGNGYELDIFEFQGQNPFTCYFDVHNWMNENHFQCSGRYDNQDAYSDDYHIYSVEWDEFYLIYRIDGEIKRKLSRYTDMQGRLIDNCNDLQHSHRVWDRLFFPRKPMSIILNLAISSGDFGNPPNSSTIFPSSLDIDYIKVYKRNNLHRQVTINEHFDTSLACYTGGDILMQGVGNMLIIDSCDRIFFIATHEIEVSAETEIRYGSNVELSIVPASSTISGYNEDGLEVELLDENKFQYITHEQQTELIISPNPSEGNFTIVLNDSLKEYSHLLIISSTGETINRSPIENDKTSYSFNLNLPGGVYSVVLEGTSGRLSKPLIIK